MYSECLKVQTKCFAMKGAAVFMKKLEILSIPDLKDVLKQRIARITSSSECLG